MLIFLWISGLLVALANGANDNAKGIATLVGSRMASLKTALTWANFMTLAGATAAIPMALYINAGLLKAFGGGGLLPASFAVDGRYLLAVGLGAAITILLATRLGIPVSTTHGLLGALIGAGLVAVGPGQLVWAILGKKFVLPLLLSPLLAAAATAILAPLFRFGLKAVRVEKQLCLCVEQCYVPVINQGGALMLAATGKTLTLDEVQNCETRFAGKVFTFSAQRFFEAGQFFTGGLVSFARGLNDTPKIAGILVAGAAAAGVAGGMFAGGNAKALAMGAVAALMLLGGLLFTRRVADTMAKKITAMDGEQGFVGSLVTAILVILASWKQLPVSTTHVSVGSLFGIAAVSGTARWKTILLILTAWITTLPLAAALAAAVYATIR